MAFKHNMLFDGKHFYVIDTDRWIKWGRKYDSKFRLNKTLLKAFKKSILISNYKVLKTNPELDSLIDEIRNPFSLNELDLMIDFIKEYYIKIYGFEPKNISDINKVIIK